MELEDKKVQTKVCSHCHQEKPVSEFYQSTVTKDGYRPQCIECAKQSAKEASLRHRAKKRSECENGKVMNIRPLTVTEKKELLERLRSDKPLSAYHPRELFEYLASIGYKIKAEFTQTLNFGVMNYTTIEQSRRLATILPLESADMFFNGWVYPKELHLPTFSKTSTKDSIPCWSLAALLSVLPQSITKYIENERCQKTFHLNLFRSYYCCVSYDEIPSVNDDNSLYCIGRDNWVDACYEMVLKLHELKML